MKTKNELELDPPKPGFRVVAGVGVNRRPAHLEHKIRPEEGPGVVNSAVWMSAATPSLKQRQRHWAERD